MRLYCSGVPEEGRALGLERASEPSMGWRWGAGKVTKENHSLPLQRVRRGDGEGQCHRGLKALRVAVQLAVSALLALHGPFHWVGIPEGQVEQPGRSSLKGEPHMGFGTNVGLGYTSHQVGRSKDPWTSSSFSLLSLPAGFCLPLNGPREGDDLGVKL